MSTQTLADHLIEQYRLLVGERYEYAALSKRFALPSTIREDKVNAIRNYFILYIYPDAGKRAILNSAFEHLDDHFKNPGHLIQLVGDASGVLFRFGFQLPKAVKAGLHSLSSFKAANAFEKGILDAAIAQEKQPPISLREMEALMATLPRKQVERFLNNMEDLLRSLTDTELIAKTVEIMGELVEQMKKHPKVYTEIDIKGLTIGLKILRQGYLLFKSMPISERKAVIRIILEAEYQFMEDIYKTHGAPEENKKS